MRRYARVLETLNDAGLRPTRQRLALAKLMFGAGDRHLTAEGLHAEAMREGVRVSLATVYNTLHQFTDCGLLREIGVDSRRSYFDTNTSYHHHFYFEKSGSLKDIPPEEVVIARLPSAPDGTTVKSVDVVVRVGD